MEHFPANFRMERSMKIKTSFKNLALTLVLAGFACFSGRAQSSAPAADFPPAGTSIMARITERLSLSKEQQAKVEPILKESFTKRRAILEKYKGQSGLRALRPLRRELEPIQKETDQKLEAVLTKEQMKEFKKLREETKDEVREIVRQRRQQR
jgi:hypothetical protein